MITVPDIMFSATPGPALLGSARGAAPKLLKEYGVSEFKRVKRAVAVGSRLRHPGVVHLLHTSDESMKQDDELLERVDHAPEQPQIPVH